MSTTVISLLLLLLSCRVSVIHSFSLKRAFHPLPPSSIGGGDNNVGNVADANGGDTCIVCTLFVSWVWQTADYHNISYADGFDMFCSYFNAQPNKVILDACLGLKAVLGPPIELLLSKGQNPDEVCQTLDACTDETGDYCRLYPASQHTHAHAHAHTTTDKNSRHENVPSEYETVYKDFKLPPFCNITGFEALCEMIERWGDDHLPLEDVDGDAFSEIAEGRGWDWRGKDCNDLDKDVYPGRKASASGNDDRLFDSNCNGIFGVDSNDSSSAAAYESLFCANTGEMGAMLLGDSAGAHFHLPPEWFNASEMSNETFAQMYFVLLNELDWPQLSMTTAFYNSTAPWKAIIQGPVDSLYQRFFALNRCNMRDYQNLGVNGARSSSMAAHLDEQIRRSPTMDKPAYVNYELLGNDVCNGHPGMSHMTTPQQFYDNNMAVFEYLDGHLPFGSKVVANGLVNGSILYESMHDRIHPIGALHNDVTYAAFYDYLNCLEISPCYGWMNSNATMREMTTARAMELNAVLEDLVANQTWQNISVIYIDWINNVTEAWKDMGGETWQLIEPVDGFHPNQLSNALTTQFTWNWTLELFPGWLPVENPHNMEIQKIFGDQGGYGY